MGLAGKARAHGAAKDEWGRSGIDRGSDAAWEGADVEDRDSHLEEGANGAAKDELSSWAAYKGGLGGFIVDGS